MIFHKSEREKLEKRIESQTRLIGKWEKGIHEYEEYKKFTPPSKRSLSLRDFMPFTISTPFMPPQWLHEYEDKEVKGFYESDKRKLEALKKELGKVM